MIWKKVVCEWGAFLIDIDDLLAFLRKSIPDERVDISLSEDDYSICISSEELDLAIDCFDDISESLEDNYGLLGNERSIYTKQGDRGYTLYEIILKLDLCSFIKSKEGVYGYSLNSHNPYKLGSDVSKNVIMNEVGKRLINILKDTDLSCSLDDIKGSMNCYKPLKIKGSKSKYLCPIGIDCVSDDVVDIFVEELDACMNDNDGDNIRYQLNNYVGYFGKKTKNGIEVMLYILIEVN